jgi:hypothetical protein
MARASWESDSRFSMLSNDQGYHLVETVVAMEVAVGEGTEVAATEVVMEAGTVTTTAVEEDTAVAATAVDMEAATEEVAMEEEVATAVVEVAMVHKAVTEVAQVRDTPVNSKTENPRSREENTD